MHAQYLENKACTRSGHCNHRSQYICSEAAQAARRGIRPLPPSRASDVWRGKQNAFEMVSAPCLFGFVRKALSCFIRHLLNDRVTTIGSNHLGAPVCAGRHAVPAEPPPPGTTPPRHLERSTHRCVGEAKQTGGRGVEWGGRYRGQWVEWGEGIAGTHTDTELSQYQRCVRLGTSLSLRQIFSDESIEGHFLVRATSLTDCAPRRQIGHTRLVLQRSAPTPEAIVAIPANILNCNRVVGTARAQRGQR